MSKLYGKKRVVLASKPTRSGKLPVAVQGGKSYIPLGFWYALDGSYHADLKGHVISQPTRQKLREAVSAHYERSRYTGSVL